MRIVPCRLPERSFEQAARFPPMLAPSDAARGRVTPTAAAVAGARPVLAPRRVLARVFAGDPRVWRLAAACALPLVALVCLYYAQPRDYDTGTNSVSAAAF